MRTNACRLVAAIAVLGIALPTVARAQDLGFQLNRYEPTAAGEWLFAVEHPWYSSTRWLAAGLTLDYAHNPLVAGTRDAAGNFTQTSSVIEHALVGHVDIAGSFLDRIRVAVTLPVTLMERGTASSLAGVAPLDGVAVGDPRIGLTGRLWRHHDRDPVALSLAAHVWIPINQNDSHAGDQSVRVLPRLILGGVARDLVRWSVNAGFLVRPEQRIGVLPGAPGNTVGSEVQLGAALGLTNHARTYHLGPEVVFGTLVGTDAVGAFSKDSTSLEVLLGGHYLIKDTILVGGAFGLGLLRQPGTPDVRALVRVAYAPRTSAVVKPLDRDGDGIVDREDACPNEKGDRSTDPARNGCPPPPPPPDRDRDGVPDHEDFCPDEPQGDTPNPKRAGCPAKDTDSDGVWDHEDQCVDVPAGRNPDPARKGCPAKDSDSDGVFDHEDQCVDVPAGRNPDPDRKGCPLPDRDGDSVGDKTDACPDKPGAPSPDPKKNGCPGLVEVRNGQIVILKPVFFATNKDVILPKSFPVLQAVADALKAQPQIKRLAVEGHTDNRGKPAKNRDLSQRRANSVRNYLVQQGIAADRLEAHGYGQDRPLADNRTEAGRSINRRVEFRIVDPAQQP